MISYKDAFLDRVLNYKYAYSSNRSKRLRRGVSDFVSTGPRSLTISSFSVYQSKLMPAPFVSDCFDYEDIGIADQAECYDSCTENKSLQLFDRKIHTQRLFASGAGIRTIDRDQEEHKWATVERLRSECRVKCSKQDCEKDTYTTVERTSVSGSTSGHWISASSFPTVVKEAFAETSLPEFIAVASSSLSF